jgi:very-short-patch-repair endonuclease
MTPAATLLHKLLEYIREQAKDIDPRGFRLSDSKKFLWRREALVGLPGVEFDLNVAGDHIWLRLRRLEANPPPSPPYPHKDFIRVSADPDGPKPSMDEAALLHRLSQAAEGQTPEERTKAEALERATATKALQVYLTLWESWAEGERPRRMSIALYGELFALKHHLESEETAKPHELVWGIGVASWRIPYEGASMAFEYPLLTQTVEISMVEPTLALELRPRATNSRVELDACIACQVTGAADVDRAMREHLEKHPEKPVTPFDLSSYSDVLKLAAGNLDSQGSYREVMVTGEPIPVPGERLVVTDAWVLFSRPRSHNYLLDDLLRLQAKLEGGCEIPTGPQALVTAPSDVPVEYEPVRFRGLSSRGDAGAGTVEELYFPLPYNDEQVTIIQRLERAPGVTVQGPPGTGKTHTIANIICHYLATGRRVLVTSRGEPALEVLQTKIPEEVRTLTVALLASDREGVRQFQASIEAIQHQVSQLNPEQMRRDIATLQSAIARAHTDLIRIDQRIDEIAVAQLSEVEVDGVELRAQKLADLVVSGQERYGWFDDSVTLSAQHAPPLSEEEAGTIRAARRTLGADLVYAQAVMPSADDLLSTTAIATLHDVLSCMHTIESEVARGTLLPLKAMTPEVLQAARELVTRVEEAIGLAEALDSIEGGWPGQLRTKCRVASYASERHALESLFTDLKRLINDRAEFLKRPVEFPDAGLGSPKTREAVERGVKDGKPFGLISFGTSEAKAHLATVRIDGLTPEGTHDWVHVLRYLDLHEHVVSFTTRWNKLAIDLSVPTLKGPGKTLREIEVVAVTAQKAHQLAMHYDAVLPKQAEAVFEKPPVKELAGTAAELKTVRDQLLRHLTKAELSRAATDLATLREKLTGKTGPISEQLRIFVDQTLGNPEIASDRVAARYADMIAELKRIAGLSRELALVRDVSTRLEGAGGLKLAARLRATPMAASGDDTVLPANWRDAWNWARMRSHLDNVESREELIALAARRQELEGGLARLYREMVAKAAWVATKRNATPRVLQALAGYATAIRRIGLGTGPNATRYRRDARDAMSDAAGAVPCWIMSHARISEAMPADIGTFDLVIVDEASQSDLWALPAILRGKKILVVGDDKQVSPDAGFIAGQRIQELKMRFLSDQPYGTEMTPEKSLYDLAARVFAAEQVMLREHFRCVPPIIAYSNRVFYRGGIRPLRIPTSSERIEPPLVDCYVEGGVRDQRDCNEYEALAIAEEIETILKEDRFAKRTIGVVSLLGIDQAKHIDTLVRQRCNAGELIRRRFECGDARTFQGSERDMMFLSMVVDAANCKAVSGNMFDQRFNVAASRARDRMYLVRSVQAADLSDKDLRMTLLAHFDKPLVTDQEEADRLIERCESGFEKQVFSALTDKGYRVLPQVKTGAYRIDMVVEGAGDARLAIECDGDEFHGPDRWPHDMNRQRVLERAGWRFWRCFASTWTLHREDVFSELLGVLTARGIEPLGALYQAPTLVEKRRWIFQEANAHDPT